MASGEHCIITLKTFFYDFIFQKIFGINFLCFLGKLIISVVCILASELIYISNIRKAPSATGLTWK